jgi:hypothetical protein
MIVLPTGGTKLREATWRRRPSARCRHLLERLVFSSTIRTSALVILHRRQLRTWLASLARRIRDRTDKMIQKQDRLMNNGSIQSAQIETLLATFDRDRSAFDRTLDQIAVGFHTVGMAIYEASRRNLSMQQLARSLALGKQQLAGVRTALALGQDERAIAAHVDSELWLIDQIFSKLGDPSTDHKAIGRLHEEFLEHETVGATALASGLRGAWLIWQVLDRFGKNSSEAGTETTQLQEASLTLELACGHVTASGEPFESRYDSYLDRYARLARELTVILTSS